MELLAAGYLLFINAAGFLAMYADKRRAVRHQWRIPEKTLFLLALFGGSGGSILGMYLFHHKTRKWYFAVGMPMILLCQVLLMVWIFFRCKT